MRTKKISYIYIIYRYVDNDNEGKYVYEKKNKEKPKVLNIMIQIAAHCEKNIYIYIYICHDICTKIKWTARSGRPKIYSEILTTFDFTSFSFFLLIQ